MKIRSILSRLDSSLVFKTVHFSRELPELAKFKSDELPAVYMLPASSRGGAEDGDIHLQQESIEVYSFCLITKAPEPTGIDEPLDEAVAELRARLFGFQIDPTYSPLSLGEGDLFDFTSRVSAWIETYVTRRTFRS